MNTVISLFLHLDKVLPAAMETYGTGLYFILFLIVFAETGLIFFPFLPGDSLLFAAGALAAVSSLSVGWLWVILIFAAIFGDFINYRIGAKMGRKLSQSRFVNPRHIERAQAYFTRYGGKAVLLARFIPIVRTFVPFIAGISNMPYAKFMGYNFLGGITWVTIFVWLGYFCGGMAVVKDHFPIFILGIIALSFLPLVIDGIRFLLNKGETRG